MVSLTWDTICRECQRKNILVAGWRFGVSASKTPNRSDSKLILYPEVIIIFILHVTHSTFYPSTHAKRKQTKKGILPFISDIWAEEVTCAVTRRRCSKQRQIRYKVEKSHFKMLLYQQSVTYRLTFSWTVHRHSQQAEKSNVKQKGGPVIVWPLCWQSGWNGGQRQAHPDWGKVKPDTTCRLSGSNPKSPVCVFDFLSVCLA